MSIFKGNPQRTNDLGVSSWSQRRSQKANAHATSRVGSSEGGRHLVVGRKVSEKPPDWREQAPFRCDITSGQRLDQ